mgnify:CR=1 FL=1
MTNRLVFTFVFLILISSCSLNYAKEENPEATVPEFIFSNSTFSRTEIGKTTMKFAAQKIERYKADGISVAKDVAFKTFSKDGEAETEGKSERVIADSQNELYVLLGGIEMNLVQDEMKIEAESLHFDRKNEQITSGLFQAVTIHKKDADITGTGFSASGISKTFQFLNDVFGTIETSEDEEESEGAS